MKGKRSYLNKKIKRRWIMWGKTKSDGWWVRMAMNFAVQQRMLGDANKQVQNMSKYLSIWLEDFDTYKKFYDLMHESVKNIGVADEKS